MNAAEVARAYRTALGECEPILVRRYFGTGSDRPKFEAPAMAKVIDYQPADLVGPIQQGDRKVILLAEDLIAAQFPLPIVIGDKLMIRNRETAIQALDDNTRRVGTTLVAYELRVRG